MTDLPIEDPATPTPTPTDGAEPPAPAAPASSIEPEATPPLPPGDGAEPLAPAAPASPVAPGPPRVRGLSIGQAIGLLVLWVGIISVLAVEWFLALGVSDTGAGSMTILGPALLVAWVVTLWVGLGLTGFSAREAFPHRRFPLAVVPGVMLASAGITLLVMEVLSFAPFPPWARKLFSDSFAQMPGWLALLTVVVVAPLTEEPFFRGLLLRGFLGRYRTGTAVAATTLLFALIHVNPWQGFSALVLGLACAWLVLRTGSIVPGMLWHATQNSSAVLLGSALVWLGYAHRDSSVPVHLPIWLLALGALVALAGFLLLRRALPVDARGPERLPVHPGAPARGTTLRRLAAIAGASVLLLAGTCGVRSRLLPTAADRVAGCYTFYLRAGQLTLVPGRPALRARLSLVPYRRGAEPGKHIVQLLDPAAPTGAAADTMYWFTLPNGGIHVVAPQRGSGEHTLLRLRRHGSGLVGSALRYRGDAQEAGASSIEAIPSPCAAAPAGAPDGGRKAPVPPPGRTETRSDP